ncbi:MAG: hypothetical protein HY340_02725 [Candidatus Kerfeldbacteria bacterium]|nr:hypothetical protein [Candidatus Kerfeldbacteria bacterium]
MNNPALLFARFVFVDVLFDVVRFPFWWYARGVTKGFRWWLEQLEDGEERLALIVLIKNLGRPMFGDYTREGRAISFVVRIVQLAVSIILYGVWTILVTLAWVVWFLAIPAVIFYVLRQLSQ